MRRVRFGLPVALASAAASVLLAGCGVSTTPEPVIEPEGAVIAEDVVGGDVTRTPPPAGETLSPTDLVIRFFEAGVGGDDDAVARVRDYLSPRISASWQPGPDLTVVRLIEVESPVHTGANTYTMQVRYLPIGVLTDGAVVQTNNQGPLTHQFTIVEREGRLWLESVPAGLMISDTTLADYYRPSPIYFWDRTGRWLVPELRYLPLTMPVNQRPDEVVRWLLRGPSPWLRPAVTPPNRDAALKTRVQPRGDSGHGVVVNLSSASVDDSDEARRKLMYQLRWSLRPYVSGPIELQIESQTKLVADVTDDDHLLVNAGTAVSRQPQLFTVDTNSQRVVAAEGPHQGEELRVLTAKANAAVRYAAISADFTRAAFVSERGTLTVVQVDEDPTKPPREKTITGLPADLGRPVWIFGTDGELLVPAAGRLYLVSVQGSVREVTPWNLSDVASVAVAPDGRRVALVAGGRAYVAALSVDSGSVTLGTELRRLVHGQLTAAAVAWKSEDYVLVAGSAAGKAALWEVTADGAYAKDQSPREQPLTDIVAFPDRPVGSSGVGDIVVQTNTATFKLYGNRLDDPDTKLVRPFYASG